MTTDRRFSNDWSAADLVTLRRLWAEGVTTLAIGREMGRTRNSVIGKAHRLSLPPRPSPIGRKRGEVREPKPPRVAAPKPPRPPKIAAPKPASPPKLSLVQIAAMGRRPPAPPPEAPPEPPGPPEAPPQIVDGCQWIENDARPWRYCGAPAVPGRPYCLAHCQAAYHPPPRSRLGWAA